MATASYQKAHIDLHPGNDDNNVVVDDRQQNARNILKRPVVYVFAACLIVASLLWHQGNGNASVASSMESSTTATVSSTAAVASVVEQVKAGQEVAILSQSDIEEMNTPLFYNHQRVDHFNKYDHRTWSNRYYKSTRFFGGAGSPIIIVVGGEGGLDHGMLYPFVTEVLAKKFNAAVLQIEHRFYGPYWPIKNPTNQDLLKLLSPHQAMEDMVKLTRHVRDKEFTGCAEDKSSPDYCPVITIGGSYPGFLSAMFRFLYPDFVDMAYASAAPLLMYGQAAPNTIYYDIVTSAADRASPGCSDHVRLTLEEVMTSIDAADSLQAAAASVGICPEGLPTDDIQTKEGLKNAVIMEVAYAFAEYNSGAYPPGEDTALYKACQIFQDPKLDTLETIEAFFLSKVQNDQELNAGCDLAWIDCEDPVPPAKTPCYSLAENDDDAPDDDGSQDGFMWNFQTCTNLIFLAGYSNTSLLPPMEATYEDLKDDCQAEFGNDIEPHPWALVNAWNFVEGIEDQSYILFTNGMQDMWMGGSFTWNVSDTVLALNFENGAHHSDLSHQGPSDRDTPDIKEGFKQIENILGGWLREIKGNSQP